MLRNLLGIAPKLEENGSYSPSPVALKLATSSKTNYRKVEYEEKAPSGQYKLIMLCTEEDLLPMKNGKQFSTGNHPVEMFLPMLHFEAAGFDIEVFTLTGKPVRLEMWAMPKNDDQVNDIFQRYSEKLKHPRSLKEFVGNEMSGEKNVLGVFVPGGHGAVLGVPGNRDLAAVLHWVQDRNLRLITICHGPAAFLAAESETKSFPFSGYSLVMFPDAVDNQLPRIGYLPGTMSWPLAERLKTLGLNIVNSKANGVCHVDRNLISGSDPKAADQLGRLAAENLIEMMKELEQE